MAQFSFLVWKKSELVFVLGVSLLLIGVSFFQLRLSQAKARDVQRKSDIELVGRALNSYLGQLGHLPNADSEGRIMACGFEASEACDWGGGEIMDEFGVTYLKNIPRDPFMEQGRKYVYEVDARRQKYTLYVVLEVKNDKEARANLTTECAPGLQCNWYVKN